MASTNGNKTEFALYDGNFFMTPGREWKLKATNRSIMYNRIRVSIRRNGQDDKLLHDGQWLGAHVY